MFTQTSDLQCSKRVDHSVGRTPYGVSEGEVKRAKRPDDTSLGCVYIIDPLQDIRWEQFLQVHHDACLFHSTAWLGALQRTYGYTPLVYTTSRPREPLRDGMVFCRVDSWLTGRRLVGLPFSDYCAPLIDSPESVSLFSAVLERELQEQQLRYIEVRPLQQVGFPCRAPSSTVSYTLHQLDLRPSIDTIFRNCHKNSTQRKILRAEREGVACREGSDPQLLNAFYELLTRTRKLHKCPPQPKKWFVNLLDNFGDDAKIRVAFQGKRAIAAMLTLRYKDALFYKYGGSDPRFHNLGSMHSLYWKAIQEAKATGLRVFDLGRSDLDQPGLITFKSRWGAKQSLLNYVRYGSAATSSCCFDRHPATWKARAAQYAFAHLPAPALSIAGEILYRHVG